MLIFDTQATVIPVPHKSGSSYVSIAASSPVVESTWGYILGPFACNLVRFGLWVSSVLVSVHSKQGGLVLPAEALTSASSREGVGRSNICENESVSWASRLQRSPLIRRPPQQIKELLLKDKHGD